MKPPFTADYYVQGILKKDRIILSKAITLIESTLPADMELANQVLERCLQHQQKSRRIAISGPPGAGKSTFINAFGKMLLENGHSLAVLAVDPSSSISKGSILGDKTRMEDIAGRAYIRPTASSHALGGVARTTRSTISLCEAFGFDYIFIETVGVGQSEIMVKNMADCFILLLLPNSGDELQGIKRGIMEMADILLISKSDKANEVSARTAAAQVKMALHLYSSTEKKWEIPVLNISATEGTGLDLTLNALELYFLNIESSGWLQHNRAQQQLHWMEELILAYMQENLEQHPALKELKKELTTQVLEQTMEPQEAARRIVEKWLGK